MPRRACLAIGVSNVLPLGGGQMSFGYLDGAVVAAEQIGQWALHCGFGKEHVQVVTDRSLPGGIRQPVTTQRVQAAVEALFPEGAAEVDHFILSFCGHGLTGEDPDSSFWLFSDADVEGYKVNVNAFVSELGAFGIRRVSLISDACRDIPRTFDQLRFESRRAIRRRRRVDVTSPGMERLTACQDGQKAYMLEDKTSANPGKCILSGVALDVLWGKESSAFSGDVIDTGRFGSITRQRAEERAREYGLQLKPQFLSDGMSVPLVDKNVVLAPPAPQLQPWPPSSQGSVMANALGSVLESFKTTVATALGGLTYKYVQLDERTAARLARTKAAGAVERQLQAVGATADLIVAGGTVRRLWSNRPVDAQPALGDQHPFRFTWVDEDDGALAVIEFDDGSCAPVYGYCGLPVVVARNRNGIAAIAYGGRETELFTHSTEVIVGLTKGTLADAELEQTIARLWAGPAANPVVGAIAAHLYRSIADIDGIRRLAHVYVQQRLAVPFDVALLGEMTVERGDDGELVVRIPAVRHRAVEGAMPPVSGKLAGRCPWLTIAWDYPPDETLGPAREVLKVAAQLLRPSTFTQLPRELGEKLAVGWGLQPYDIRR